MELSVVLRDDVSSQRSNFSGGKVSSSFIDLKHGWTGVVDRVDSWTSVLLSDGGKK